MTRGHNLKAGQSDGDRGRSKAGRAHAARNKQILDDLGRTYGQYWAMLGWFRLVEQVGRKEAGRIQARRGAKSYARERREYSRYLGEMRALATEYTS